MIIKKILVALIVLTSCLSFSQSQEVEKFYYDTYDWKKVPETVQLTVEELEKDEVTILEKKYTQFYFKNQSLVKCVLEHKIIRLNNDVAIENNNKYYVSNYGSTEVVLQKARVINPDGKIIELSVKDIQVALDENGNPDYQYFAFEGIQIGSVIEYLHVMLFDPEFSGTEVRVQSSDLKKNVEYEVIVPMHLEFKIKSINGLPDFVLDTLEKDYNRYFMHSPKIEGVEAESSSAYKANVQKFYYMLYKNTSTNKSNIYNYQDVTKNIHSNMYTPLTSKELKLIKNFIKLSKANLETTTLNKVIKLEDYLKSTIAIQEDGFQGSDFLPFIFKNKRTDEVGATKLMVNCLRFMNINFELVLTCDRFNDKFITDFQGYNFLKNYLIYINELDGYFEANLLTSFGYPSYEYIFTEGLFIKEIKIGELVSSVGAVKKIKGNIMDESSDDINAYAVIDEDKANVTIQLERVNSGYKAVYQSFIDYTSEEQRKEIKDEFLNYIDNEIKPENVVFENDSSKYYGVKPFIGRCTLKSPNFIEQAGDKMLFKIGMLIGPQANLYNSKERKLPVETEYLKVYNRTITLEIPTGYNVKNLSELVFNVSPEFDNKAVGFTSSYIVKDNKIIVTVKEWYNTVNVSVANYKEYENVINAAADFNKLVIVLQKN